MTNWVRGGNISVRGVQAQHVELLASAGNVSVSRLRAAELEVRAGGAGRADVEAVALVPLAQITGDQVDFMEKQCAQGKPACTAPDWFVRDNCRGEPEASAVSIIDVGCFG
eukprot:COSAG01_NODE_3966_length_5488_cov_65.012618_1_plen_111_part_00